MNETLKTSIAFCGDSFCADYNEGVARDPGHSWLDLVAEDCDLEIVQRGVTGASFFTAYTQVKHAIKHGVDYIVICVTHFDRLPNKYDLGITASGVMSSDNFEHLVNLTGSEKKAKEIDSAQKLYYDYLYKQEYHAEVHGLLIKHLDNLLLENQKKCIWFPCFSNSFQDTYYSTNITSGPYADIALQKISITEPAGQDWLKRAHQHPPFHDSRKNHMGEENNQNMAKLIIDIIENDAFDAYEIQMQDRFGSLK